MVIWIGVWIWVGIVGWNADPNPDSDLASRLGGRPSNTENRQNHTNRQQFLPVHRKFSRMGSAIFVGIQGVLEHPSGKADSTTITQSTNASFRLNESKNGEARFLRLAAGWLPATTRKRRRTFAVFAEGQPAYSLLGSDSSVGTAGDTSSAAEETLPMSEVSAGNASSGVLSLTTGSLATGSLTTGSLIIGGF